MTIVITIKKTRTLLIIFIYNVYYIFFIDIAKKNECGNLAIWQFTHYYSTRILPMTNASERISCLLSANGAKLGLSEWHSMLSSLSPG